MSVLLTDFAYVAVGLAAAAGSLMLLARTWRLRIAGLALQYVAVFWLVALSWPVGLAVIKLVIGWMAGAVLGISRIDLQPDSRRRWPTEGLFLGLVLVLVALSASTLVPGIVTWLPRCHPAQAWGGLLLIGMGLVHLGVAARGLRVIISLLTTLSGFEILYAVVERSALVAALLAVVTIGIALAGAYLMGHSPAEEDSI